MLDLKGFLFKHYFVPAIVYCVENCKYKLQWVTQIWGPKFWKYATVMCGKIRGADRSISLLSERVDTGRYSVCKHLLRGAMWEYRGPHRTCQWSIYDFLLLPSWNIPVSRGSALFKLVSETQNSVLKCGEDCFLLWNEKKLRVVHGKEFLELEARKVRQNESKCQWFYSRVLRTATNTVKCLLIEVGIS